MSANAKCYKVRVNFLFVTKNQRRKVSQLSNRKMLIPIQNISVRLVIPPIVANFARQQHLILVWLVFLWFTITDNNYCISWYSNNTEQGINHGYNLVIVTCFINQLKGSECQFSPVLGSAKPFPWLSYYADPYSNPLYSLVSALRNIWLYLPRSYLRINLHFVTSFRAKTQSL